MIVALIVAAAENGVIGRGGGMPWRLSTDLRNFRRLTMGKPVVMGRKTFHSIGKALDGRTNIVVSRDASFVAPGAVVAASLEAAIEIARRQATSGEVMVIGGAEIYRAALPLATRIYLTRVHAQPDGDATFVLPATADWAVVSSTPLPRGEKDDFDCTLVILERRNQAGTGIQPAPPS